MKKTNLLGLAFVILCVWGTLFLLQWHSSNSDRPSGVKNLANLPGTQVATGSVGVQWNFGFFLCCLAFAGLDILLAVWAYRSIKRICDNDKLTPKMKLQQMGNEDVLFDLPLYLGLLGTVLGFLLVSRNVHLSRDMAYVSTVFGILVSAFMRVFILRPRRSKLLAICAEERDE